MGTLCFCSVSFKYVYVTGTIVTLACGDLAGAKGSSPYPGNQCFIDESDGGDNNNNNNRAFSHFLNIVLFQLFRYGDRDTPTGRVWWAGRGTKERQSF